MDCKLSVLLTAPGDGGCCVDFWESRDLRGSAGTGGASCGVMNCPDLVTVLNVVGDGEEEDIVGSSLEEAHRRMGGSVSGRVMSGEKASRDRWFLREEGLVGK